MRSQTFGESGVVEDNFCAGGVVDELEFGDRINTRRPVDDSPGLNDALIRDELDVAAEDVPAKEGEGASGSASDLRRRIAKGHAGLHGGAEVNDFVKLLGIEQGLVDALARRFEDGLLMNGFLRTRDFFLCRGKSFGNA